jgi:peptidoglycan/LPS O-acetylase OafA/YrhL
VDAAGFGVEAALQMLPSENRLGYVPGLDGLRGIAILLVVTFHYFGLPPGGFVGVDLFFVLSGFLITTLLLEERAAHGRISVRGFYERRARRLLPALFAMLAVYLIAYAAQGHDALALVSLGGLYVGNIAQAWNLAPLVHTALAPLWSLAEEEQYYLVWPLLLLLLVRSKRPLRAAAALLAAVLAYKLVLTLVADPSWERLNFGPDTHADGLLFGSMLAIVRVKRPFNIGEWGGKLGIAALASGALLARTSVGWVAYGLPVFEIGLVLLVTAAVSQTELAKGLRQRHLVGLGKISYSVYLWHGLVWYGLAAVLALSRLDLGLVALPVTLAVSVASYRFVETPFRRRHAVALPCPVPISA